jgi:hypothetical protein
MIVVKKTLRPRSLNYPNPQIKVQLEADPL